MTGFYEQATEHPELGWMVPVTAWAPIWGLTKDELTADYEMQIATTGTFHMRKEWVRHAKGLIARYGTEDLDVIYMGEGGQ